MWKVFDSANDYRASIFYAEDAAAFVSIIGDGATVRSGTTVVWTEGQEKFPAGESYDQAAFIIRYRSPGHQDFNKPPTGNDGGTSE